MAEVSAGPDGFSIAIRNGTHRRCLTPGFHVDGAWIDTDLSGETQEVRDLAAQLWTPEKVAEVKAKQQVSAAADAPGVPRFVTMRQARLALSRAGRLADAETAIAAMTGQPGEEARLEWEYATEMDREHALVANLGAQLGMTEQDIDALFVQAARL